QAMGSRQPKNKLDGEASGPTADKQASPMRWGAAALLLSSVLLAARLALPQPIAPSKVPFPQLDARSFDAEQLQRADLLSAVSTAALPKDLRSIGELVRHIGRAEYQRDFDEIHHLGA